jgi:Anthrone oxygenase
MKLKLAQFSTIVLFALVMGVFWGTWFVLSRSIVTFRAQTFLDIGQTAIRNLAIPMRIMMPLALLSAAVLLVLLPKRSVPFAWAFAGFVLMVCALVVTLAVEVPIDNQIKVSTAASLPANWEALRDRWESYHTLRTFLSIAALIAVTTSTLSDRP